MATSKRAIANKIRNDSAFERTRETMAEFARAGKAGKSSSGWQEPTPKFFKVLRNIGVTLAAISAAVFAAPVELPAIITKIAGYIAVAGSVMGVVSQTAVLNEEE